MDVYYIKGIGLTAVTICVSAQLIRSLMLLLLHRLNAQREVVTLDHDISI